MVRERSDIKKASGLTLYKIAKALDVTIESLIELDSSFEIDKFTGKPKDDAYFECSLNENLSTIIRNLKNAIFTKNELKQSYWKDLLIEEITALRRRDEIGLDSYEYFCKKYLGGDKND